MKSFIMGARRRTPAPPTEDSNGATVPSARRFRPFAEAAAAPADGGPPLPAFFRPVGAVLSTAEVFTPGRPPDRPSLLVGRDGLLRMAARILDVERRPCLLYGPPSAGKTSVARLLERAAALAGHAVRRHICGRDATFEELVAALLPAEAARPASAGLGPLAEAFRPPGGRAILLVVDEVQRAGADCRARLGELAKAFGDLDVPALVLLAATARTPDEILGAGGGLRTVTAPLEVPRLGPAELMELGRAGGREAGLDFEESVLSATARLALGSARLAHRLYLLAGEAALASGRRTVERLDLAGAAHALLAREACAPAVLSGAVPGDLVVTAAAMACIEAGGWADAGQVRVVLAGRLGAAPDPQLGRMLDALSTGPEAVLKRRLGPGGRRYAFRHAATARRMLLRSISGRSPAVTEQPLPRVTAATGEAPAETPLRRLLHDAATRGRPEPFAP